jgi:hypothetical protein
VINQVHGGVLMLKRKRGLPARVVDVTVRNNIALCTAKKYYTFIDDSYARKRRDEYCPWFPKSLNAPYFD